MQEYDFSCYAIKYGIKSIRNLFYDKDIFKSQDGCVVPLIWNHMHGDPRHLLGQAILENRDDGLFVYGQFNYYPLREACISLLKDKGSVSVSPYSNGVIIKNGHIVKAFIKEISLVPERMDSDEAYYPVMKINRE